MKFKGIPIKNLTLTKTGKLEPVRKAQSVSERIRQRKSKRVRVGKTQPPA